MRTPLRGDIVHSDNSMHTERHPRPDSEPFRRGNFHEALGAEQMPRSHGLRYQAIGSTQLMYIGLVSRQRGDEPLDSQLYVGQETL